MWGTRWGSSINPAIAMEGSGDSSNPVKVNTARREVTLPPGIGQVEFARAMDDLRGLIGAEHVVSFGESSFEFEPLTNLVLGG